MSEQEKAKSSYMQELEAWLDVNVIAPLVYEGDGDEDAELTEQTIDQVKKAIRGRVLESYRNGQAAGPRQFGRQSRRDYPPQAQPVRLPMRVR